MYPYGVEDKRSLNLLILEILKVYSDKEHRLKQEEVMRLLEVHYGVTCDRRSVKNNITSLMNLGYPIPLKGGYCLQQREFEDEELRMLIDSILFHSGISRVQKNRLIEKVIGMGNKYFQPEVHHISGMEEHLSPEMQQIQPNLDVLNEAIRQRCKVSFRMNEYGMDKRLHPAGEALSKASPYQVLAAGGRYFLFASIDGKADPCFLRIDRMTEIQNLKEPAATRKEAGAPAGSQDPSHRANLLHMDMAPATEFTLQMKAAAIGILVDWFGMDFSIREQEGETVTISLRCQEEAMYRWSMLYGDRVEILEPESLRQKLRNAAGRMMEAYNR